MEYYKSSFLIIFGLFSIILIAFSYMEDEKQQEVVNLKPSKKIRREFTNRVVKENIEDAFHGTLDTVKSLGCFEGRKFEAVLSTFNPLMDLKKCENLARDRSYRYFGLTKGHMCMAGNTLPTRLKKSKGCIIKCPGNKKEIGGGNLCSSVYRIKGIIPKKTKIPKKNEYWYSLHEKRFASNYQRKS